MKLKCQIAMVAALALLAGCSENDQMGGQAQSKPAAVTNTPRDAGGMPATPEVVPPAPVPSPPVATAPPPVTPPTPPPAPDNAASALAPPPASATATDAPPATVATNNSAGEKP